MMSSDELIIHDDSVGSMHISIVGAKAIGISNLPRSWVPKFFVLGNKLSSRWDARYSHSEKRGVTVKCEQILAEDEISLIADALKSLGIPDGGHIIVRSSSPKGGIELRGALISEVSEATPEAIMTSCDNIYQYASSEQVKKYFGPLNLALIVQTYVKPKAIGHLSNERRVAKRRQEWLYEFEHREKHSPFGRFALKYGKRRTIRANTEQLTALNEQDLIRQLRSVAAYIDGERLRLHMEWIWDGQRLWIVQGDKDPETQGRSPQSYLSAMKSSQSAVTLKSFVPANSITHDRWHKLLCPKDFRSAELPTADLWVLEDTSILLNLQNGSITEELKQDIETLVSNPIVIRMDIAPYSDMLSEMLPRSDCLTTPEATEEFLIRQSRGMLSRGIDPGGFCFIVHRYIPSRSSAFCLAYPNRSRVRIDSIWGLPDGLLFYPHDSFELNPGDLGMLKKHIRFKDNYLASTTNGEWIPVRAGRSWDWAASIRDEELALIGKASQALADYVNDCVQIMWFVDIPDNLGLPSLLPWWYKRGEPPGGVHEADPRVFNRNRIFVSTQDDVEKIPVGHGKTLEETALRLTPKPELLRDGGFLKAIANKAKEHDLPVELQGSILQHAYYQLKRSGVKIQCVDFFTPVFLSRQFGKLVRDQIPLRIQKGGERVYTVALTGEDLVKVLKAKAVEESLELQSATNVVDIEEELGDILEVILSLAERMGFSIKDFNEKVELKRKERGGFREGLLLIETKEVPLIDIDRSTSLLTREGRKARLPLLYKEGGIARITTRRIPRHQNGAIAIPLVPPDIREAALRLEDLGVVLKIRYEDKEVVLRWARETPKVSREQLRLFE